MSTINELWLTYLNSEGYTTGSINERMIQAFQANGSSSSNTINEAVVAYLEGEGYSGNLNDMLMAHLDNRGYSGTLQERLSQSLTAGDFFGDTQAAVLALFGVGDIGGAWSCNAGIFQNTSQTIPCTTLNDPVASVTELRSGNHATQSNSSFQPFFIEQSGVKYVYVNNTGGRFLNLPSVPATGTWTIAYAGFCTTNDNNAYEVRLRNTNTLATFGRGIASESYVAYINNGTALYSSTASTDNAHNTFIGVMNGASSAHYLNGSADGSGNAGTGNWGDSITVLCNNGGTLPAIDIYMSKIWAIDRVLDSTEIATLHAWLNDTSN